MHREFSFSNFDAIASSLSWFVPLSYNVLLFLHALSASRPSTQLFLSFPRGEPRARREIPTCRGGKNSTRSSVSTIRKALFLSRFPYCSLYSIACAICGVCSFYFSFTRIRIMNYESSNLLKNSYLCCFFLNIFFRQTRDKESCSKK